MDKRKLVDTGFTKRGFTVIEVTLVLAITMMMFVGLIANTSVNITKQRYNDSVQNFSEFLRREYNEAITVENPRDEEIDNQAPCTTTSGITAGENKATGADVQTGRSNCLVYGKLITVGEYVNGNMDETLHAYDIIGDVMSTKALAAANASSYTEVQNELIRSLANVSAGVMTVRKDARNTCYLTLAGNESTYSLEWGAWPATVDGQPYRGSIIIVRSPVSGAVSTFTLDEPLPVQAMLQQYQGGAGAECYNTGYREARFRSSSLEAYLVNTSSAPRFAWVNREGRDDEDWAAVFCVESEDRYTAQRRMIGILRDGYNASAVRMEDQDSGANRCL